MCAIGFTLGPWNSSPILEELLAKTTHTHTHTKNLNKVLIHGDLIDFSITQESFALV